MAKHVDYTPKVDALVAHAAGLGFTKRDFVDLVIAALDQAGAGPGLQKTVRLRMQANGLYESFTPHDSCVKCQNEGEHDGEHVMEGQE